MDDQPAMPKRVDPELAYKPRFKVKEEELCDSVHRLREAESGHRNKKRVFEVFMRQHGAEYEEARKPRNLPPELPVQPTADSDAQCTSALEQQCAFIEARKQEDMTASSMPPTPRAQSASMTSPCQTQAPFARSLTLSYPFRLWRWQRN